MMKLRRACCNPALVAPGERHPQQQAGDVRAPGRRAAGEPPQGAGVQPVRRPPDLIRKHLDERGIRYQYLDGSTPMQERKRRVDAFQAGDGDLFLISLKAGGVGINLTAADYVIHMDPWWNPAVEDQASGPRAPHGPATAGDDLPAGGAPHDRGRHRRPAPPQARPGRQPAGRDGRRRAPVAGDMLAMLQAGLAGSSGPRPSSVAEWQTG
jgi:hypothetical protein